MLIEDHLTVAMATGAERWSVTDACAGAAHVSVLTVTVIIRLSEEHTVPFIVRCVRGTHPDAHHHHTRWTAAWGAVRTYSTSESLYDAAVLGLVSCRYRQDATGGADAETVRNVLRHHSAFAGAKVHQSRRHHPRRCRDAHLPAAPNSRARALFARALFACFVYAFCILIVLTFNVNKEILKLF